VLKNPGSVKRGSLNVRFAPKATELLRHREMTSGATLRHWLLVLLWALLAVIFGVQYLTAR
jgi:hypothetical protein